MRVTNFFILLSCGGKKFEHFLNLANSNKTLSLVFILLLVMFPDMDIFENAIVLVSAA